MIKYNTVFTGGNLLASLLCGLCLFVLIALGTNTQSVLAAGEDAAGTVKQMEQELPAKPISKPTDIYKMGYPCSGTSSRLNYVAGNEAIEDAINYFNGVTNGSDGCGARTPLIPYTGKLNSNPATKEQITTRTLNGTYSHPPSDYPFNNISNYPPNANYNISTVFTFTTKFKVPTCVNSARIGLVNNGHGYMNIKYLGNNGTVAQNKPGGGPPSLYPYNASSPDYPEMRWAVKTNDSWVAPLVYQNQDIGRGGSTTPKNEDIKTDGRMGATSGTLNVTPSSDGTINLTLFVQVEIEDMVSNRGLQSKYQLSGGIPTMKLNYNTDSCKSYDRPYVRATGNDIWSGAVFADENNICSYSDISKNAQINTTNLTKLNRDTSAHLLVERMYQAVLGESGDRHGVNTWSNTLTRDADDDLTSYMPTLVNRFIRALNGKDSRYANPLSLGSYMVVSSNNIQVTGDANIEGFIKQIYPNVFGRAYADASDRTILENVWAKGLRDNSRSPIRTIAEMIRFQDAGAFGILHNGLTYSYGGSGSEYGAFSTGGVLFSDGLTGFTGRNGLPRGLGNLTVNNNLQRFDLMFSNIDNRNIGNTTSGTDYGNFTNIPLCLPDYYGEAIKSPTPQTTADTSTIANTKKTIIFSGTEINELNIAPGADLTIIKKGDLKISGNITYASQGTLANPTHLTLIVEGNLNITSGAKKLDGNYIVQPDPTNATNTGILNTCSDIPAQPITTDPCATQLEVNGQVIAQQLRLNRLYGSIGYSNSDGPTLTNSATNDCLPLKDYDYNNGKGYKYMYGVDGAGGTVNGCAAELFNFDPSVYLNAASQSSSGGGGVGDNVQSRQELPPIY